MSVALGWVTELSGLSVFDTMPVPRAKPRDCQMLNDATCDMTQVCGGSLRIGLRKARANWRCSLGAGCAEEGQPAITASHSAGPSGYYCCYRAGSSGSPDGDQDVSNQRGLCCREACFPTCGRSAVSLEFVLPAGAMALQPLECCAFRDKLPRVRGCATRR